MPPARSASPARSSSGTAVVHRLHLDEHTVVPAPSSQSLLISALQAGTELTSSCRNGTCRACIRQLASGCVTYRIEWPGLSAEEKSEGFILPCVAYPLSDIVLKPLA